MDVVSLRRQDREIGLAKVVTDAQERLLRKARDCIAETVPQVQGGRVPSLAVPHERLERLAPMVFAEGDDGDPEVTEEPIEERPRVETHSHGQDDSGFDEGRSGHSRRRRVRDSIDKSLVSDFLDEDGDERRRVDDQVPSGP